MKMVRQNQQKHFVDQDKSTASRNSDKTTKIALDWSHAEETSLYHHQTCPDMEFTREEEKRTANKHLLARHGVGSGDDGQRRIQWRPLIDGPCSQPVDEHT